MPGKSLKCRRCGGRLRTGEDVSCLMCRHIEYGKVFAPLTLTSADQRRLYTAACGASKRTSVARGYRQLDIDGR
jgi:hypothetical protein